MPQLVFRFDDGGSETFVLDEDQIGIGRESDNPIVIDNSFISSHHARLTRGEDGAYTLFDLGSNNGTFVNERPVSSVRLKHGDQIRFGSCEVDYLENLDQSAPADPQTEPPEIDPGQNGGAAGGERRDRLTSEVSLLETRHQNVHSMLLDHSAKLEQLTQAEIPAAERELEAVRGELAEAQSQLAASAKQLRQIENLEEETRKLQSKIESLYSEHDMKKVSLQHTLDEIYRAEAKFAEVRDGLSEVEASAAAAEARAQSAQDQHRQLVEKNKTVVASLKDAEADLEAVSKRLREESERKRDLMAENQKTKAASSREQDKLKVAEAKVAGIISDWNDFEKEQLKRIIDRKSELESACGASEKRLQSAQDELTEVRSRIKRDTEEAQRALDDLRLNHYEPTKELHEELTLRNEEIAHEIALRERRLAELRQSISESEETEKVVSGSLATRGDELRALEQRTGEEYERIEREIARRLPRAPSKRPRILTPAGPIFAAMKAPPIFRANRGENGRSRVRLTVFEPSSAERAADFADVDATIGEIPLPTGFAGLAAATGGAFETSLAAAAKRGLPVLFIPGPDLEKTGELLRKLRAALPSELVLLGWRPKTFKAVTKTLDSGSNFQDLTALLELSDGSLSSDLRMNSFFDSLNQGPRLLLLPHALPWNPRSPIPFNGRQGIFVDAASFEPGNPSHRAIARDLKEIVEVSRLKLTIPNVSEAAVKSLLEHLDLGDDWATVIPNPEYPDLIKALGDHLAVVSFESVRFDSPILRDALLARTILLAGRSEALQAFFPDAAELIGDRHLPEAEGVVAMIGDPERFSQVIRQAEKTLVENYSYQAAARRLDGFVSALEPKFLPA